MSRIPYTMTDNSISIIFKGRSHVIQSTQPNFAALKSALQDERWGDVEANLSVAKALTAWAEGEFTVEGNEVSYKGTPMPDEMSTRVLEMAATGHDPMIVCRFYERLMKNPSRRSVTQLWVFLKHMGIPLTPDGCFLAYKGVNNDLTDCHTGKIYNTPGTVHEMPRNLISDDPREACHFGFHVGAIGYARGFASRTIICKVDPEHVVCVPYDSSAEKMRVCKYEVIGHYSGQLPDGVFDLNAELEDTQPEPTPVVKAPKAKAPAGKPKVKAESAVAKAKAKVKGGLNDLDEEALMEQSLEALRKYARWELDIVGASKMGGGKVGLVARILKVRALADSPYRALHTMDTEELMGQDTMTLRKYACHDLEIVGASKLPGGKATLVAAIIEVRG